MKKLKTWWIENGDFVATIIITILLMLTTCLFGYIVGTMDGYAEGYVSANTNQYTQHLDRLALKNITNYAASIKYNAMTLWNQVFLSTEQKEKQYNITIQYEETAPNIDHAINQALNEIPENIIQRFEDEGWTIVVCYRLPSMEYKDTIFSAVGITSSADKLIQLESFAGIAKETLIHEFGHYVDMTNNRFSNSKEWIELYKEEWENLYILTRSFHDVDSPSEYFAEIFNWYLKAPQAIETLCPKSYLMMQRLIENT